MSNKKEKYQMYISSEGWLSRHNIWLKATNNRCLLFPWKRVGTVNGRYYPYAIHHLSRNAYQNLGREVLGKDVLVLSKFVHDKLFHHMFSGGVRTPGKQKNFPNRIQTIANNICRFNLFLIRLGMLVGIR